MTEPVWPGNARELQALQYELAAAEPDPYVPDPEPLVCGVFVCFQRSKVGGDSGDERGWAAAAAYRGTFILTRACVTGHAAGPYVPGRLALREGPLLARAVIQLGSRPDVLLVNATGRDHPRRAGLALHLGAVLDLPSIGVTDRPFLAQGEEPGPREGDRSLLSIDGDVVASMIRVKEGARPLVLHPGWRTDLESARRILMCTMGQSRTPRPLAEARTRARVSRSVAEGLVGGPDPCAGS